MPSPNLNEVTDAIVRLLEESVQALLGGTPVTVSKLPPEKAEEIGDTRLNVYLYHVARDTDGGNDLVRGSADRVPVATRPLALKLFYVLTAHAMTDTVDDITGQQMLMGWAMKALHDRPTIDDDLVVNGVQIFPTIGDRCVEVVLRPISPEEAVAFWATDQVRTARLSAYYEVHTLLLPPEAPSTQPGVTTQVMLSVRPAGMPSLRSTSAVLRFTLPAALGGAQLAPSQSPALVALKAVADADSVVTATGLGLGDGRDAVLVLRGQTTAGSGLPDEAAVLDPAANAPWAISVTDTTVHLTVGPAAQATTPTGMQAVNLRPGSHTVSLRREVEVRSETGATRTVTIESNRVPIAIAPYVTAAVLDAANHVVITVEAGYDAQAVEAVPQLAIGGDVYRLVDPASVTPGNGDFFVVNASSYEALPLFDPTLHGRTYPLRLSVNGVDSQPFWLEVA